MNKLIIKRLSRSLVFRGFVSACCFYHSLPGNKTHLQFKTLLEVTKNPVTTVHNFVVLPAIWLIFLTTGYHDRKVVFSDLSGRIKNGLETSRQ